MMSSRARTASNPVFAEDDVGVMSALPIANALAITDSCLFSCARDNLSAFVATTKNGMRLWCRYATICLSSAVGV